jgi:hypothetical protein
MTEQHSTGNIEFRPRGDHVTCVLYLGDNNVSPDQTQIGLPKKLPYLTRFGSGKDIFQNESEGMYI